ncbi:MAG TPA: hypothetical protein VFU74_21670 [Actinocrinis sp.]|nr:hypothetical protein [Actinocrinis sp.]
MPRTSSGIRWGNNRAALAHAHGVAADEGLIRSITDVFKVLASATDYGTWARFTSCIQWICDRTGYKRTTVNKALRILRQLGLIVCDGYGPGYPRRVVFYRLASTLAHPLPGHVLCARKVHFPDCPCAQGPTCGDDHMPKSPQAPVPASGTSPHLPYPAPSRSAEGVRSGRANPGENVNGTPRQRHPRPAPTPPKGRPTPRRATHAPRAPHPALEIVAHVVGKLTPGQLRAVHAHLRKVMREQRIGTARMNERLRHWRIERPDNPMGWLLYAIQTQPYGCPREDCEDGTLWDPATDTPQGPCRGCEQRKADYIADRRAPDEPPPLRELPAAWDGYEPWAPAPVDPGDEDELYGPRRRNPDGTFNNGPAAVSEWHHARTALKDRNRARKERS